MFCDLIQLNAAIVFESFISAAIPRGASRYNKHFRNEAVKKARKLLDVMGTVVES
jgi:hypothetical protein